MKLEKQGQILSMTLLHGLVDHAKVVAWTDEIMLNSDVPEPWMIDISMSKGDDYEECALILTEVFSKYRVLSFNEYMAVLTKLYNLKGIPIHECLHLLVFNCDSSELSVEDDDSKEARKIILHLDSQLFTQNYSAKSIGNVTPPLNQVANKAQAKHRDLIEFIDKFA